MSVKCFDSCMTETGVREELDKYSFAFMLLFFKLYMHFWNCIEVRMSDVFVDSPFCGTIIELHLENGGCVTNVDAYSEHFDYRFVSIDKL